MAAASPVAPSVMDEIDLLWLTRAVEEDEFGWTPLLVMEELLAFRAQFWRLSDGAQGGIVTRVEMCPRGRFLMIWFLAGIGFIKGSEEIFNSISEGAKKAGCFALYGQAKTRAQQKMYERFFGAKRVGFNMILEI